MWGFPGDAQDEVVTGVEMFKKQLDEGLAGDNAGLLLRGSGEGRCGARHGAGEAWIDHAAHQVQGRDLRIEQGRGRTAHAVFQRVPAAIFYFRTTDVTGTAKLPEGTEMVMPGDNVQLEIELHTPVAMEKGLRFAIREGGRTVGAGTITEIVK